MSDIKSINPSQELALAYFHKAENDLLAVRAILAVELVPYDAACFHCQQLAEKYLKGFLAWHSAQFERTHDLERLVVQCSEINAVLACLLDSAGWLTQYAVRIRYPDFPEDPTPAESLQALDAALMIRREVRASLHLPEL